MAVSVRPVKKGLHVLGRCGYLKSRIGAGITPTPSNR